MSERFDNVAQNTDNMTNTHPSPDGNGINRTIIAIYGRQNEGKTQTIHRVCRTILNSIPQTVVEQLDGTVISPEQIDYSQDILLILRIGDVRIGIESQGDPHSRMINEETLSQLAERGCQIIVCASRTSGMTVQQIDNTANEFDYHTLYLSSYFTGTLNHTVLNQQAAESVVRLIFILMAGVAE